MEPAVNLIGTEPMFERLDAPCARGSRRTPTWRRQRPARCCLHQAAMPEFLYILPEGQGGAVQHGSRWNDRPGGSAGPIQDSAPAAVPEPAALPDYGPQVTECEPLAIHAGGLREPVEQEAPLRTRCCAPCRASFVRCVGQVRDRNCVPRRSGRAAICWRGRRMARPNGRIPAASRQGAAGGAIGPPAGETVSRLCHAARVWRGDARVARHSGRHRAAKALAVRDDLSDEAL